VRSISTDDNALFTQVGGRATYLRVDVQDNSLTWQDLTTYAGQNMVIDATWRDGVDGQGQNGEITVKREVEQLSLAPMMTGSPLNLAYGYPGSYAALLKVKRGVRIYTADVSSDTPPSTITAGQWRLMFDGKIDSVDSGASEGVKLEVSDAQGDLRDLFIEAERVYAYAQGANATKGCSIWTPLATTVAGQLGIPTDANRNGHFFSTSGGVSTGSPEPTWPTAGGGTVGDGSQTWTEKGTTSTTAGTAVETVIQQIIADNGGGAITLQLPGGSPGWMIKWFLQQRQSVWDAIRALVDQIGWDIRYKFDAGSGTFKLTLWLPDRAKSTPDRTFAASEEIEVGQLKVDVANIRNAIQAVYSISGSSDPSGNPLRVSILVTDSASITKYGRRFMEIGEASTSNIDTSTEATTMVTNALSDLKEPSADKDVSLFYFPFVELGDLYRFSANGIYNDTSLDLAVIGYEHSITADGESTTKLSCRGKPSTGCHRWLARGAELNADDIHQLGVLDHHSVGITAQSVVGGTLLTAGGTANKKGLGQDFEWHIGTTVGFTPDSTTLVQSQGGNQITAPQLIPSKSYIAKIVPIRRNAMRIVRGQPSADFPFVAGQASTGHLSDGMAIGDYPLNGGFETRLDTTGFPDHWSAGTGAVLGSTVRVMEDGNGVSGTRYMRLAPVGSQIFVNSAQLPIVNEGNETLRNSGLYRFSCWCKNDAGNAAGTAQFFLEFFDYQGSSIGLSAASANFSATTHKGHWVRVETYFAVGGDGLGVTTPRSIRVQLATTAQTFITDVDEVRIQYIGTPWYKVGDTTRFTDNYEPIPGFNGAWGNFGGNYTPARFRKDQHGTVWLDGLVSAGVIGTSIFTLPVGYRPALGFWKYFDSNGYQFDIRDTGTIVPQGGVNTHVWLGGIFFRPDTF
jgi:hypothetical protein